jgi:hypothetical protein
VTGFRRPGLQLIRNGVQLLTVSTRIWEELKFSARRVLRRMHLGCHTPAQLNLLNGLLISAYRDYDSASTYIASPVFIACPHNFIPK